MACARAITVRGVVQGVGFRPFVYRAARARGLCGWVLNGEEGVEIHIEGEDAAVEEFLRALKNEAPPAARIASIEARAAAVDGFGEFTIRESERRERPTVRISPDLPVCDDCLREMANAGDRRYSYPYINCTNCGPRYSLILALPYDRPNTTMRAWPLDEYCDGEYRDPGNRRFHAQPVACGKCGPHYYLRIIERTAGVGARTGFSNSATSLGPVPQGLKPASSAVRIGTAEAVPYPKPIYDTDSTSAAVAGRENQIVRDDEMAIRQAVRLLRAGAIVAVKGLGGYHLACDARNATALGAMRERKFRKEKPFAVMVPDVRAARELVELTAEAEKLLTSAARPIVLAPAKTELAGVAPDNRELGVMLPYTPMQHLLFAAGAPEILVMTSANRSSEPIAYEDEDAMERLGGLADAFLMGERPIARRVEDSVARAGALGPAILRRSRGYAPGTAATLPVSRPILALGADLKNTITLVVEGQAFVSQHIGDLDHYEAFRAFAETIHDLTQMYEIRWEDVLVVHDAHPEYRSTMHALGLGAAEKMAVQHHRAHVASVLAERGAWDKRVLGVSFDGTGYGDDGTIWGGEFFVGSLRAGFERVAHLRTAALAGGDAAAQYPVQAAAGFLLQVEGLPDLSAAPFSFPARYGAARQLVEKKVRTFATTSMGRLFDTAAALLGFTREITFEGQAAMWVEQLARSLERSGEPAADDVDAYPFPFADSEMDFRPLLLAMAEDRARGRRVEEIARAFQRGVAVGMAKAVRELARAWQFEAVVLSGGVFQNEMLLEDVMAALGAAFELWTNHAVPANDGGISLGQAALAACRDPRAS